MGHFGFSYVGFLFLLLLFIPNFLWTKHIPKGYTAEQENKMLLALERIGEVLTSICALVFSDFNLRTWSLWSLWLLAACLLLILYECYWVRYFRSRHTLADFYSSFLGIPVAGATLPVLAFLLLAIYGKVLWLAVFVAILGIGHIGIHLQHRKEFACSSSHFCADKERTN